MQFLNQMLYPVDVSTPSNPIDSPADTKPASGQKPRCFVIIQIGKDGSPERLKSDRVLKYIIANALDDKYDVRRADDIRQPGTVTVQIIEQLLEAPLVVADLSDFNANVYYELAIRHAVKKPVVHLITKGQEAPFDVNQMRYVSYDITAPESVEAAQRELRENVQAVERGVEMVTPIQFTQLVLSAQSEQSRDGNVGMILNAVSTAMSNIHEELQSIRELVTGSPQFPTWLTSKYLSYLSNPSSSVPLSDLGKSLDFAQTKPTIATEAVADWLKGLAKDEKKD